MSNEVVYELVATIDKEVGNGREGVMGREERWKINEKGKTRKNNKKKVTTFFKIILI